MERDQATELIHNLLRGMISKNASDLFITTGFPPAFKVNGQMKPVSNQALTSAHTQELARAIMNDRQAAEFEATHECNFAISPHGIGRFRVNVFMQQQHVGMVLRTITTKIPDLDAMGLPPVLKDIVMTKRGLVILVGGTGSGKSTTLAAMIGHRNKNSYGHIITIEDPVEYVHRHKNCIINQREVGVDTRSFRNALKNTLRQAPDVILIGEIRDRETMEHALEFAETGHLAISTLHANNANQALERIINLFPDEKRPQLLMGLSQNIRGFVSQRLIPTVDGKRCAAVEVLLGTKTIQEMILKNRLTEIKEIMEKSETLGMQTFDAALFKLYQEKRISLDEAVKNADSPNNLRLRIKLAQGQTPGAEPAAPTAAPTAASAAPTMKTSFGELSLQAKEEEKKDDEPPMFRPR